MVRVHDMVVYGIDGICHVASTTSRKLTGETIEYYVLKPIAQEGNTVYVPMDNQALVGRMQRLLSLDEVIALIRLIPNEETIWIEDEARRRNVYNGIMKNNDRRELFRLIKTLYQQDQVMKQNRRKLPSVEEKLMKEAERRLFGEFAHVLKIEPGQVLPYIFNIIGEQVGA